MAAIDLPSLGDQRSASPSSVRSSNTTAAKASDFHNGRLRLSAYLRVIEHLPDRPRRCRRHVRSLEVSPPGSEKSSEAPATNDETRISSAVAGDSTTGEDESVAGHRSSSDDTLPPRQETSRTNEQDPESLRNQLPVQQENVLIATAEQPEQPVQSGRTRRKRPTPVNTLALARATTEAGLPVPGVRTLTQTSPHMPVETNSRF